MTGTDPTGRALVFAGGTDLQALDKAAELMARGFSDVSVADLKGERQSGSAFERSIGLELRLKPFELKDAQSGPHSGHLARPSLRFDQSRASPMQHLRAAFLTAVGIGLIAFAMAGVAERDMQARLERALLPEAVVQTVSSAPAAR